jgi:hypothetical protein
MFVLQHAFMLIQYVIRGEVASAFWGTSAAGLSRPLRGCGNRSRLAEDQGVADGTREESP